MNIFMTVTDSYVPYCGVALKSALENNRDILIDAYIVCPDLSEENRKKMKHTFREFKWAEVYFIDLDCDLREYINSVGQKLKGEYNTSYILRLLMDKILPINVEKVLYIDADTIVVSNLRELEEYQFNEDIGLCAVKDLIRDSDYSRLGLDKFKCRYFNSGVLLVNLKFWRKFNISNKCLNILLSDKYNILLPDQDALNIVLQGHVDYLHPKYNCLTLYAMRYGHLRNRVLKEDIPLVEDALNNPVIIHYVSVNKPWFKFEYVPYKNLWDNYLKISEWRTLKKQWRGGFRGSIRILIKNLSYGLGMTLGVNKALSLYKRYHCLHIRLLFLLVYYCFAQYLPNNNTRWGGIFNKLRVLCVSKFSEFVGKNVRIDRRVYFGNGTNIRIGDNVIIKSDSKISSGLYIDENNVLNYK